MSKKNDIFNISELRKQILDDVRVELADEFDRNFQRKGFFGKKWKPRKDKNARGSLQVVTGALRRSVQAHTMLFQHARTPFCGQQPRGSAHDTIRNSRCRISDRRPY